MKKANLGGTRITELRELMKYSQKDFAKKIGITQGALSQIESDKTQASFETIRKISDEFNINCNWLISGAGEVLLDKAQRQDKGVAKSTTDKVLIPLIKEEAHAGYIKGYNNKAYFSQLDVYQIPGFEKGEYRLFEIVGDSMIPTLYPGEIVVCEFIADRSLIENSSLCVLISKEGIVAKRVFQYPDQAGLLILKSDNANYKTQTIKKTKVLEAWTVRAKITSLFTAASGLENKRLQRLESDLDHLKTQMAELMKTKGTDTI